MIARFLRPLVIPVVAAVAAAGLALAASPVRAQAVAAPDEMIRTLSVDVLDRIRADKDIQAGNVARISDFVEQTIMPNVNFERMTALAVGRGWRQATPDQQKKLQAEFRVLLVRTYAGALSSVRDQQVRMRPFRADPADTDVVVRSEIVPRRGDPIQLDYRLEKTSASWKIYDVNVLGVWLVETYRNQFAQEISARGIDGLIQSLVDKNKAFEAAARRS